MASAVTAPTTTNIAAKTDDLPSTTTKSFANIAAKAKDLPAPKPKVKTKPAHFTDAAIIKADDESKIIAQDKVLQRKARNLRIANLTQELAHYIFGAVISGSVDPKFNDPLNTMHNPPVKGSKEYADAVHNAAAIWKNNSDSVLAKNMRRNFTQYITPPPNSRMKPNGKGVQVPYPPSLTHFAGFDRNDDGKVLFESDGYPSLIDPSKNAFPIHLLLNGPRINKHSPKALHGAEAFHKDGIQTTLELLQNLLTPYHYQVRFTPFSIHFIHNHKVAAYEKRAKQLAEQRSTRMYMKKS